MQTLARLKVLRLAFDEEAKKAALTQQSALAKGQAAAKFISGTEAQVYRRHAALLSGATADEVDLGVVRKMLKEGSLPAQVRAALRTSPGLAERYPDVKAYVKETLEDAKKSAECAKFTCALNRLQPTGFGKIRCGGGYADSS